MRRQGADDFQGGDGRNPARGVDGGGDADEVLKQDAGYVTAMSHFYRGEMGRILVWRSRLDATTNWAITVTSTVFTVAFSIRGISHLIFFFNIAVVWILLWIEARRYRFYDAFRARVRLLEAYFFAPMVIQSNRFLKGDWQRLMCEDLFLPRFKISRVEAVGLRLKRNYIYLFLLILSAWVTKIFLHAPMEIASFSDFYAATAAGHGIAPWFVVAVVVGAFCGVIGTTIYFSHRAPDELSDFGPEYHSLWKF